MKNTAKILPLAALCLGLPACLENEEKVEIRADGSVRVSVAAEGQVFDLAGGYPVPLDPAWSALGETTEFWLQNIGTNTGHGVRDNVRQHFPPKPDGEQQQSELRVTREFASVQDWPRWFAPESEPYRTAYMGRSATLAIDEQEGRTVYTFERTYHGTDYARLDIEARIEGELGESFWERMKEPNAFAPEELTKVRDTLADIHMDVAELFVRDALLGVYTGFVRDAEGKESAGHTTLPARAIPAMVATIRTAVDGLIDEATLRRVNQLIAAEDGEALEQLAEELETRFRDTLRNSLAVALLEHGLDEGTVNAVLFGLEWGFTAFDHYGDLSDENFTVEVAMPGTLVGGNFHLAEENRAAWRFSGEDLQSGDVTLRVVSVLEQAEKGVRRR